MEEKRLRLRSGRLGRLRPGHPWIFKNQILKTASYPAAGSIVSIDDSAGRFVGRGYYNPRSEISVRLLTFKDEQIDKDFLSGLFGTAVAARAKRREKTDAYRAVFSEADSMPGLIVDIYGETAVFQVLTLGMDKMKAALVECIAGHLRPKYIYEKSVSAYRRLEGLKNFSAWHGEAGSPIVEIREAGARFLVDIVNGHKTGFYLDQRTSRMAIGQFARGKKVLDAFCYSGAFGVAAALGGAREVVGIDIKGDWLDLGAENSRLNNASDRMKFIKADAFGALKDFYKNGEGFDIVIIDPPSFLKKKESLKSASRGYRELNYMAMNILNDGGVLATFSCSHNMPNEIFSEMVKQAARQAKKKISILKRCHQAEDHPIVRAIPETEYLKGYFLKISTE